MFDKAITVVLIIVSLVVAGALYQGVDIIHKGGPVVIPIILCSIFGLAIAIEKKWQLHKARIDTEKFLRDVIDAVKRFKIKEAIDICDSSQSPISRIL